MERLFKGGYVGLVASGSANHLSKIRIYIRIAEQKAMTGI
jgi:hypothetical protein